MYYSCFNGDLVSKAKAFIISTKKVILEGENMSDQIMAYCVAGFIFLALFVWAYIVCKK